MCTSNTNTRRNPPHPPPPLPITPKLQDGDQFNVSLRLSRPSPPSPPPLPLRLQPVYFSVGVIEYTHLYTGNAGCSMRKHTHAHLLLSGRLSSLLRSVCFWLGFNGSCLPRPKISIIGTVGRLLALLSPPLLIDFLSFCFQKAHITFSRCSLGPRHTQKPELISLPSLKKRSRKKK